MPADPAMKEMTEEEFRRQNCCHERAEDCISPDCHCGCAVEQFRLQTALDSTRAALERAEGAVKSLQKAHMAGRAECRRLHELLRESKGQVANANRVKSAAEALSERRRVALESIAGAGCRGSRPEHPCPCHPCFARSALTAEGEGEGKKS